VVKKLGILIVPLLFLSILVNPDYALSRFRFFGEEIHMAVLEDSVEVMGIYEFRSTVDEDMGLPVFYPYVMDEHHGRARTILVETIDEDTTHVLNFKDRKTGSSWYLDLPAKSSKKVKVVYRQELKANTATYILTTTRVWNAPLEYAHFYVTLPPDKTEGAKLSYAPDDTTRNEDGSITYTVKCRNLLPDRDLTVTWPGGAPTEKAAPTREEH
jgi:hypothetical protein